MDLGGAGPRWTKERGSGGGSPELLFPASMGHNSIKTERGVQRCRGYAHRSLDSGETAVELWLEMVTMQAR
jgi:hypothetical protein